MSKRRRVAAD